MAKWPVKDAKGQFSRVLELAESEGPQVITRHGKERAVILSIEDYRKLEAARPDFRDYLLSGPKVDDFDVERSRDVGRDVEL